MIGFNRCAMRPLASAIAAPGKRGLELVVDYDETIVENPLSLET